MKEEWNQHQLPKSTTQDQPKNQDHPAGGNYVLATKYDDGDPCDHFCVGFVSGMTDDGRYLITDGVGNIQRLNGFRKAVAITDDEGRQLVELMPAIGNKQGPSLWWHLAKIRGKKQPDDPCGFAK